MKHYTVALVLFVATVAFAAAYAGKFSGIDGLPRFMKGGFFAGSSSTAVTENRVTEMTENATGLNYDFAPLKGTHATCHTAVTTATVTGCGFHDTVSWGADQTIVADIMLMPYVSAANTVSLRACAVGITDAGEADMPDASYWFRCISNE